VASRTHSGAGGTPAAEALAAEALRVNARYLAEAVVGWGLCPWAERALTAGQVRRRVLLERAPAADPVLSFIDELAASADAAIGLALFPRAELGGGAFDSFAERVRRADRARRAPGAPAPFLIAAFHPAPATTPGEAVSAPRLVPLLRRTPDPTLQLVRATLLDGLGPAVSADVGRHNFESVGARGIDALDALLRDIRRDRDDSYARLPPGE
jgi:hypothetical protein